MSLQRQHFLLSYFKTLSVCPAGFEPVTARSADRKSPNWANQAAVISLAYLLAFSYGKSPQTSKLDGEDTKVVLN